MKSAKHMRQGPFLRGACGWLLDTESFSAVIFTGVNPIC